MVSRTLRFDLVLLSLCATALWLLLPTLIQATPQAAHGFLTLALHSLVPQPSHYLIGVAAHLGILCILVRLGYANPWLKLGFAVLIFVPEFLQSMIANSDLALNSLLLFSWFFAYRRRLANLLLVSVCLLLFNWYLGWLLVLLFIGTLVWDRQFQGLLRPLIIGLGILAPLWLVLMLMLPQPYLFVSGLVSATYPPFSFGLQVFDSLCSFWPLFFLPIAYSLFHRQWILGGLLLLSSFLLPPQTTGIAPLQQILVFWPLQAYLLILLVWDGIVWLREGQVIAFIVIANLLLIWVSHWPQRYVNPWHQNKQFAVPDIPLPQFRSREDLKSHLDQQFPGVLEPSQ